MGLRRQHTSGRRDKRKFGWLAKTNWTNWVSRARVGRLKKAALLWTFRKYKPFGAQPFNRRTFPPITFQVYAFFIVENNPFRLQQMALLVRAGAVADFPLR